MQTANNQSSKQVIIDIITQCLEKRKADFNEYQAIYKFLEPLEGKELNGRLGKKLAEMNMKITSGSEKMYIVVSASGNEHSVCYDNNRTINLETFKNLDNSLGEKALKDVKELQALLDNSEMLNKQVEKYDSMKKGYQVLKQAYEDLKKDKALESSPAFLTIMERTEIPYLVRRNLK